MNTELIEGYRRFRAESWPAQRRLFETLARDGQHPAALVIACIDSRVDPAAIFNAGPGELLTVRNVANLVPPYEPDAAYHGTSAAIEFGVRVLRVPHIVVMGHGSCGGVQSLLNGAPENARDFVGPWMSMAVAARDRVMRSVPEATRQQACEHELVKLSLANLMTFPWVAEAVESGRLSLHGAWFAIHTGVLATLQPDGTFTEI